MAYTAVTNAEVGLNGITVLKDSAGETIKTYTPDLEFAELDGDGFEIDVTNVADNKLVLLFMGAAGTVTLKAGDMIQGVNDVDVAVVAEGTAVRVDSGAFKNKEGKILVESEESGLTCAVIVLP